jgi:YggT family protein
VIVRIIVDVLQLYIIVLFVRIIFTWFPIDPWTKMARVVRGLARVTDPVLVPMRRILPPLRIGAGAIDLSPIVVFVILEIIISILR